MKKVVWFWAIAISFLMASCGSAGAAEPPKNNETGGATGGDIAVVSREVGSGTRSAFEELVGLSEEAPLTQNAVVQNGNGTVATFVDTNPAAIGYVSFSTLQEKNSIRGIAVDGVEPTVENVLNGEYALSRPFVLIYDQNAVSEADLAFIKYLESQDGLMELESHGAVVDMTQAEPFDMAAIDAKLSGDLKLGGSTSTETAIIAVAETFTALFPNVNYTYDSTGSGAGIKNAQDGTYSIGFSSREVEDSELAGSVVAETFCKDGIAIVVKNENELKEITKDQLLAIYTGEIKTWDGLK